MTSKPAKWFSQATVLLTAASMLWSVECLAAEFVGETLPDPVLEANITALAELLEPDDGKGNKATLSVSRLLGKETLGEGRYRVWYCVERDAAGTKSSNCGGDILLTRLDTGRWIIKDENRGAWLLAQK